ncbi:ATP-binding protein [Nocardioides sp. AE5]|uniref:ATP-binding protein n=1 Tax=Nocardioides sp. AE5 TaxID=2962573 RepID=UPI002882AA53|nr:ATP-binding protein [Nocardioides sp. AE5]MDT0202542.1 ATP-binding protein [Nocardioides sp. AE5]
MGPGICLWHLPHWGARNKPSEGDDLPLSRGELTLEASPRSVKESRRWVTEACHELGRDDLADNAELGISELVTNAILHGSPPIQVRVRGTRRHPRIEVLDGSFDPPVSNQAMTEEDELFATFGRGLAMVAMVSHAWGSDLLDDGKVVWFEPADGPVEEPDLTGQVFSSAPSGHIATPRPGEAPHQVVFSDFPIAVFLDWRRQFRELRRELRLLALAHEGDYPVAGTLTALFERFDAEIREAPGMEELNHAIEQGAATADFTVRLSAEVPEFLTQMRDVLDLADAFCREERLLSVAANEQQVEFRDWFIAQVLRQYDGLEPQPWSGLTTVAPKVR